MAYEERDFVGAAPQQVLGGSIDDTTLTIPIASGTGWPAGGANGDFFVTIDRGLSTQEVCRIASRTGNTLTVAAGGRGDADTTAFAHSSGAPIEHTHTVVDSREANDLVSQTLGAASAKGEIPIATGANALGLLPAPASNDHFLISDSTTGTGWRSAVMPNGAVTNGAKFAAGAIDQAAGTGSARTLGTGATQAAAGNHTHSEFADFLVATNNLDDLDDVPTALTNLGLDNLDGTYLQILNNLSDLDDAPTAVTNLGIVEQLMPTGTVLPYAAASAPTGYLLCDGAAVSRATYAELFALIDEDYGVGDGSTTFNVPDLRGRTPIGLDNLGGTPANNVTGAWADSLGGSDGEEEHDLTTGEIPSHSHPHNPGPDITGFLYDTTPVGAGFTPAAGTVSIGTAANTGTTGGGNPHNNMQPSIALSYIIKT